jgi:hypothetical protein
MSQIEYVTTKELAQMCNVTTATVRVWVKNKIGPQPIRVAGFNLYRRQEAIEWAKSYVPFYTSHKITKERKGK